MNVESRQPERAGGRIRIVIVDDHPLVREGLAARISAQPDLEVCGQAEAVDEASVLIRTLRPALVLLDLALKRGNGLDLIRRIKARGAGPRVLVVSAYDEALFAERAIRAGAHGYINKQELQVSVVEAIRAVLRGEVFLSAELSRRLAGQALAGARRPRGPVALSNRELQVFERIGCGRSTREIATELRLSVHTIESHRENIRAKLNLRNGTELMQRAVIWALENSR
jgi:DNA-binding NarL/FixJ family response regulator